MVKFFFVLSICLAAMFLILAVEFRCLGRKAKFLLPKFSMIPREEQKQYDLDRLVIDASDTCITFIFYVIMSLAFAISCILLTYLMYLFLIGWSVYVLSLSPKELYKEYRKIS